MLSHQRHRRVGAGAGDRQAPSCRPLGVASWSKRNPFGQRDRNKLVEPRAPDPEGRDFSLLPILAPSYLPPPANRVLLVGRGAGACGADEERTGCSAISWSGVTTSPGRRNSTMRCLSRWALSPASRTPGAG